MGCVASGEDLPLAEFLIIKCEIRLPYNNHAPIFLDFNHRKYSFDGKINEKQMETVKSLLFIENFELFDRFLDLFKCKGEYLFRQISLASLLLSNGSFTEKAKLFFEIIDVFNEENLHRGEIEEMVDDLIEISVEKIPSLVREEEITVLKYRDGMRRVRESCKKKIVDRLCKGQDTISTRTFVDRFLKPKCIDFLTSRGLRKFLYLNNS